MRVMLNGGRGMHRRRSTACRLIHGVVNADAGNQFIAPSSQHRFSHAAAPRASGRRGNRSETTTIVKQGATYVRSSGIESRPIVAGNFTRNPGISWLDAIVPESLPVADKIHFDGLFAGNHYYPVEPQLDELVGVFDRLAEDA